MFAGATNPRAHSCRFDQEPADGDDTLNWIARQAWSDGKIGMMGGSYVGIVQWKAALLNNPHLKAIFPVVSGYDDYRDRYYSTGGAMKLGNRLEWMAENMRAPGYHQDFAKYVLHLPVRSADVAALGWTSPTVPRRDPPSGLRCVLAGHQHQGAASQDPDSGLFRGRVVRQLRAERPGGLRGAAQEHGAEPDCGGAVAAQHVLPVSTAPISGTDSSVPIRSLQIEWFDQWLMGKDTALLSQPPLKIFVMGANKWREEREWPPEQARYKMFYLDSNGRANSLDGDGAMTDQPSKRHRHGPRMFSIRTIRCRRAAVRSAAIPRFSRGGQWISGR